MNNVLPDDIEHMFPDYSIYPQYDYAVSMTSRGCPRGCDFCHVKDKEGRKSVKVANVEDFWNGQQVIQCCDPNLTACRDKRDLFGQYRELSEKKNVKIEFNQGLDIRLLNDADVDDLKHMKVQRLHFAWDKPEEDLREKFKKLAEEFGGKGDSHGHNGTVYCLTNFGDHTTEEHIQLALDRIYFLKQYGFAPFVMIYNKPSAPKEIRKLQRWCNNKFVFYSTEKFEDYDGRR